MSLESIVVTAILGVVLAPMLLTGGRRGTTAVAVWLAAVVGLGSLTALLTPAPALPAPTDRPIETRSGALDYVSSRTCRACHPHQYATWRSSYHRAMTQPARPDTVVPTFAPQDFEHGGSKYSVERRDDRFWVEIEEPASRRRPGAPARIEREIVQVTGSHHTQVYWHPTGDMRKLSLFPFAYRVAERQWIPIDAAFLMPPEVRQPFGLGRWNTNCSSCHATGTQPRLETMTRMDTRVAEFGIACEACHGPADEHIRIHRNPLHRYAHHIDDDASDPTITNPVDLPPRRAAQACGQCHSVSIVRERFTDVWRNAGLPYRPGALLEDTRLVVTRENAASAPELRNTLRKSPQFLDASFWSDGNVRITGREYNGLLRTPCFTHDDETRVMTCSSCHQLHQATDDPRPRAQWADSQMAPDKLTNHACTQCHEAYRTDEQLVAHTHHEPGSSGSSCFNCHMSYSNIGMLKAIRSHTIESPRVQTDLTVGRPNACNQCHLDETLDWTATHLEKLYGIEKPELSDDQHNVAASVLWTLEGDAGQRALMAWSFGWDVARATSGTDWMTPYLAELMRDPYHAVRFIARRSLTHDPAFADFDHDFMAEPIVRQQVTARLIDSWERASRDAGRPQLLIGADGQLRRDEIRRLLARRDHRQVFLNE